MKSKKVIDGIRSVLHNEGLDACRNYRFMGKSREIWHDFRQGFARAIYNNRKEIGLFTLDDIEIDDKKIKKIIKYELDLELDSTIQSAELVYLSIEISKAIAAKKPIKNKGEKK